MASLYLLTAFVGGALFVCQMLLTVIGGSESDGGTDASSGGELGHSDALWSGLFSFRAIAAAV
ncbi:MAG TPA: hypothetical protein VGB55_09220, partial [Tepidisphaeraceae bacterium]